MEYNENIKNCRVYSDYVKNGFILPKKSKYTLKDFNNLLKAGFDPLKARFICICSCIYYYEYSMNHISKIFNTTKFMNECKYNNNNINYFLSK